ncbi:hypothetical protein [Pelagibacterium xiamenense]|uniref:hypothetical protein n=1 Tax=Pelagibacterium xiamenense TaxID=2901140 RepID=UPI001E504F93|nr:hypothetical protein [Pelagibacterium xiamenense]MCD7060280.1 hypothetical protein [Pelagibacterium xiamenense]
MPGRTDPRIAYQNLIARYTALHADLTAQAKVRNAGEASAQAVRLVRTLLADTRRHLDSAVEADALPFLPKGRPVTASEIALTLSEARAVLEAHAATHGHDKPPAHEEITREQQQSVLYRFAQLTMMGIEEGVEARMAAIAKGEDPEEAYSIFHTQFYKIILASNPELAEGMREEAPRLAKDQESQS